MTYPRYPMPPLTAVNPGPGGFTLYRYFDAADLLLYVGLTIVGPTARWEGHLKDGSKWVPLAKRGHLERIEEWRPAEAIEASVVQSERPLFNLQYQHSADARVRLYDYLAERGRLDLLTGRILQRIKNAGLTPTSDPDAVRYCLRYLSRFNMDASSAESAANLLRRNLPPEMIRDLVAKLSGAA